MFPKNPITGKYEQTMETSGNLSNYAVFLGFDSVNDLLSFVNGKSIVDLGSGSGLFALESLMRGIIECKRLEIFSVNKRYDYSQNQDPRIQRFHDQEVASFLLVSEAALEFGKNYTNPSELDEKLKSVLDIFERQKIASSWEDLSYFKDNSIDCIFAVKSYIFYPNTFSVESLHEIMRIIKPGGEFRIGILYNDKRLPVYQNILDQIRDGGYSASMDLTSKRINMNEDTDNYEVGVIVIKK